VAALARDQDDLLDRGDLAWAASWTARSWAAVKGESTSTISRGWTMAPASHSARAVTIRSA
jgi:hypothetical protein